MSSENKPPARVAGRRKTAAPKAPPVADLAKSRSSRDDEFLDLLPPREPDPEPKRRDPAEVASTIQLEWEMMFQTVTPEDLRSPGTVCVVSVPTGAWAEPASEAWTALISGPHDTWRVERLAGFTPTRPMTLVFARAKAPEKYERERDAEAVAEAIWRGYCIAGFSPDPDWLPPDLVVAADHRLCIEPLDGAAATELARRLTGSEPTLTLAAEEAAAAGPRVLRLACRLGITADQYLGKLRGLVQRTATELPQTVAAPLGSVGEGITLDQLAGMDAAVAWGMALKEDLGAYRQKRRSWADIDKGVLLSGPPGCGKTTYAKALARTCGVPLFEGSWSRWLANGSGHQGDFMLAMKKTFTEARERAPCVLFLDEIDSFPDRATLTHAQRDWGIQCVNALLAELDGVQGREGVVVVAACNHPHLLDAALTRSGRLDRHIRIGLPDTDAIERIMRVHLREELPQADLRGVALRAVGSSGADIERLVRRARRRARDAERPVELTDLLAEIGGNDRRTPGELRIAGVHEAGHAIAAMELSIPIAVVSIQGSDGDGGHVQGRPGTSFPRAADIRSRLVFILAGRAAEEVILGGPTAGSGGSAESDLARATWLAAKARADLGFGDDDDLRWIGIPDNHAELRGVFAENPPLATRVKTDLADTYRTALDLVVRRRAAVEAVADALVESRVLQADEVQRIATAVRQPVPCG